MVIQVILAFIACWFFSIIFNAPKKELFFCGLTGAIGWFFYTLIVENYKDITAATFISSVSITISSRYLSHFRRAPSTLYLIPGIIPLVPGAGIYYTMYYAILNQDSQAAFLKGVETLKIAGAIAIGIIVILALPYSIFNFIKLKEK